MRWRWTWKSIAPWKSAFAFKAMYLGFKFIIAKWCWSHFVFTHDDSTRLQLSVVPVIFYVLLDQRFYCKAEFTEDDYLVHLTRVMSYFYTICETFVKIWVTLLPKLLINNTSAIMPNHWDHPGDRNAQAMPEFAWKYHQTLTGPSVES